MALWSRGHTTFLAAQHDLIAGFALRNIICDAGEVLITFALAAVLDTVYSHFWSETIDALSAPFGVGVKVGDACLAFKALGCMYYLIVLVSIRVHLTRRAVSHISISNTF